jgi:hypothetical protein
MRKIIFLAIAIIGITNFINAQEKSTDYRDQLQFGIKLGFNYSNVYDSEGEDFKADGKFGLATGAFLSIPLGTYLGVQPELLFSQKGFKATGVILGNPYEIVRTSNFIDIPLLFAFKPSEFITVLAGPQFSYLIKQTDSFTSSLFSFEQEQEFENDNIRKNTLCFVFGGDINFNQIVLSGRAGWDIQKNVGDGTSTTPRYKNVWYQMTIGFRF